MCVCPSVCLYVCSVVWLLYVSLTLLHLYANYRAVTAVTMDTFNQSRLHIVISHWLTSGGHVLSVSAANQREPVFTGNSTCTCETCRDVWSWHYVAQVTLPVLVKHAVMSGADIMSHR